jgi:hypothetical protein
MSCKFAVLCAIALTLVGIFRNDAVAQVTSLREQTPTLRPVAPDGTSLFVAECKRLGAEVKRLNERSVGLKVDKDAIDREKAALDRAVAVGSDARSRIAAVARLSIRRGENQQKLDRYNLAKRRLLDDYNDIMRRFEILKSKAKVK